MRRSTCRNALAFAALVFASVGGRVPLAHAQTQGAAPAQNPQQTQPAFASSIDVVGVTPIAGLGVNRDKVPTNVQSVEAGATQGIELSVADWLASLASVHVNEAQSNLFQPDLQFRGFTGSPLLGLPQGIVVYQDGVRANEPFGDTINWDLLPVNAVQRMDIMPGANPVFGSNALGGAIVVEMKTGFRNVGSELAVTGGAFGRRALEGSSGARHDRLAYFTAGRVLAEDGWRDFSPSRVGQLFGNLAWQSESTSVTGAVTIADNRLVGNGPAPIDLLEQDRHAIFTHPDRTSTSLALVNAKLRRVLGPSLQLDAAAYNRPSRIRTFNGDDTQYELCDDDDGFAGKMCLDDEPIRDLSGRLIPARAASGASLDATNNTSATRNHGYGASAQITQASPLRGRSNQLVAGLTFDAARSRYESATELASLTETRGTIGSGLVDTDSLVGVHTTTSHLGAYVADFFDLTPALTVSGSVRLNRTAVELRDQIGTALDGDHDYVRVNPSVGAAYAINPNLTAYGNVGVTSRAPTPSELSCADPDDACRLPNAFVADPPLDQVKAMTMEGGVRGRAGALRWSSSVFRTRNRDDIIFVSSGALTNQGYFTNIDRTTRDGLELIVESSPARLVHASASYTFLRARFDVPLRLSSPNHPDEERGEIDVPRGASLPGIPRHNAKFTGRVGGSRASVQATLRWTSSQYFRGDEANLLDPIDGYTILNLDARVALSRRLELFGNVANLTNAEYDTFGLLGEADDVLGDDFEDPRFVSPGAPRAAWVGLRLRF